MGSEKNPFIKILQFEEFRRAEVPEHYEVVLGVKTVVEAHRAARAVRGIVRGSANTEPQNNCGCENCEAGQNEQSQAAIDIVVHLLNDPATRPARSRGLQLERGGRVAAAHG